MLKKFGLLSLLFSFLAFCTTGFAIVPPKSCPKVSKLRSQSLILVQQFGENQEYIAFNVSDYGTSNRWGFIIARIKADDEKAALKMANQSLWSLVGRPAPYRYNGQNFWECDYAIGNGYFAVAITPVPAAKLSDLVH